MRGSCLRCLIVLLTWNAVSVHAQTLFSVDTTHPTISIKSFDPVESKLSTELWAAVKSGSSFIGVTTQGQAVLSFDDQVGLPTARNRIASLNLRSIELGTNTAGNILPVTSLIVFARVDELLESNSVGSIDIAKIYKPGKFVVVTKSDGNFTPEELQQIADDPRVLYAEPSFPRFIQQGPIPNDPLYVQGRLWGLKSINAESLWSRSSTIDVLVAVIDTGADLDHPDLKSNLSPDGKNFLDPGKLPFDENGHGTHVAGTIAAITNNSVGVAGVASRAKILPLKVFSASGRRTDLGFDADVVAAIDYAIDRGAKIINCSFAGPNFSVAVKQAIARSEHRGILVVAAASNDFGNDNDAQPRYPASYVSPNVISVLAVDEMDILAPFSNYGAQSVHLGAPGSGIVSTSPNNAYVSRSGTSQAAPFVSGAIAYLWSSPDFASKTAAELKSEILLHVRTAQSTAGKSISGGTLDLSFLAQSGISSVGQVPPFTRMGKISLSRDDDRLLVDFEGDGTRLNGLEPSRLEILRAFAGEAIGVRR